MKTNILATAVALSDQDLLNGIDALARTEREASVELVAHLAALELRPALYAAQGYGSLFAYCTHALRLPEDVACNRIQAVRTCRRFPEILELLASGSLTFSTVRMGPHLTESNHEKMLAQALNRTRERSRSWSPSWRHGPMRGLRSASCRAQRRTMKTLPCARRVRPAPRHPGPGCCRVWCPRFPWRRP
jgi:hypothetical protein